MKKFMRKLAAVCLCICLVLSFAGNTGYAEEMISECETSMVNVPQETPEETEIPAQTEQEDKQVPETDYEPICPDEGLITDIHETDPDTSDDGGSILNEEVCTDEFQKKPETLTEEAQNTEEEIASEENEPAEYASTELTEEETENAGDIYESVLEEETEEMTEGETLPGRPKKITPLGTKPVTVRRPRQYRYSNYGLGSYSTGEYHVSIPGITSDSYAYCVNPGLVGAVSGNFPVSIESVNYRRILYYSVGNYAGDKNWFVVNGYNGWAAGKKYIIIHLAVARNNNSSTLATGATSQAIKYANALRNYALDMPVPPSPALALSKSDVTAYPDNGIQRTEEIVLAGSTDNYVDVQLGKGIRLVNVTSGRTSAAGASVRISGGDHFYLTAPLNQAAVNGSVWRSDSLQGAVGYSVQAYRVAEHDYGKQDLIFLQATPATDEVQLTVRWYKVPEPKLGTVKIHKKADPLDDGTMVIKNLHFTLTLVRDPEVSVELVTDAKGEAEATDLKPGIWRLEETTHHRYFELADPVRVEVYADQTADVTVVNHRTSGALRIMKVDSETGNMITRSHATFSILDAAGKNVKLRMKGQKEATDLFETDDKGEVNFEDELKGGKYTLREVEAPEGFETGDDISFEITTRKRDTLILTMEDEPIKRKFAVTKIDEKTGERLGAGYSFNVHAASEILDEQGNKRDIPDMTIVTNAEGIATTDWLYPGIYEVKETAVSESEGMALRDDIVTVDLTGTEEDEEAMNIVKMDFKDKPTSLRILKTDAETQEPLSGVEFRITADPEDESEGKVYTTDAEGKIELDHLKADMTYYVTEVKGRDGYCSDHEVHEIHVDKDGLIEGRDFWELTLTNSKDTVEISKQKISKGPGAEEIPGAHLKIEDADGQVIDEWVSGTEPHIIRGLAAGDYILTETLAPEGYMQSTEAVHFTVTDTMEVQKVIMYNAPIQTYFHKQDITDTKELPGAKLEVLTEDGEVIDSWISTDEPHCIEMLAVGSYILRETQAPDGYEIAEEVKFEIRDDGQPQIVRMFDNRIPEPPTETESGTETESEPHTEPQTETETPHTPTPKPPKTPKTPGNPGTPNTPGTPQRTPSSPKTGDGTPIAETTALMFFAFAMILAWLERRKAR